MDSYNLPRASYPKVLVFSFIIEDSDVNRKHLIPRKLKYENINSF